MKLKTYLTCSLIISALIILPHQKACPQNYYAQNTSSVNKNFLTTANRINYFYASVTFQKDSSKRFQTKAYYLQRSKNQKTAGWILLGAGTAMAIVGTIGFSENADPWFGDEGTNRRTDIYGFILLAGVISDLISIPLFISASHNKKIASSLSLSNLTLYSPQNKPYSQNVYPSITLKIRL